ncbi:pilus assembly protein PilM [Pontiella sulfatireligans]|uniref:SHS2 domain-containing protein n=1 Tax=Pontiella sulfatireligans TaxID=2750658 RepID=A0A6C2UNE8_9BACT|nr:pilus assembly protein PilM [Pontiella sulfatireligans]VGO21589.1 hypothetical protein SCARR_03663 [Pontiella sulfatireligans]
MKADRFITLDINEEGIRLASFVRHGPGRLELSVHGYAAFASGSGSGMTHEAVVATTLKRLLDETGVRARKARIAVDGKSVFSRVVKLPPVAPEKQAQTIRHEAVQNIPFPIDEVVWDFHVFDPAAAELEVLLVAAKSGLAEGLVLATAANGLAVEAVGAAPAALANAVRCGYPELTEPLLLADFGAESTNLVFIDGPRMFFRTLSVAGSAMPRLLQEVERSIAFFRTQQNGSAPQRVLLSGGEGDPDEIGSRLGLPVEIFDPLRKIEHDGTVADSACFGVLAGLAMQDAAPTAVQLDLAPESLRRERIMRRRRPLQVACVAIAALTGLVWLAGWRQTAALAGQEAGELSACIKTLEKAERRLVPLEARMAELESRAAVYQEAVARRIFWLKALAELRERLPDGMFVVESEALRNGRSVSGMRITVASYLDKEPEGGDAVVVLRDSLRESTLFNDESRVFKRPTKRLFFRSFVLDLFFREPLSQ